MYNLKERKLTPEQYKKILEMNIPNSDENTDDGAWLENSLQRIDRDWENTDKSINIILKNMDNKSNGFKEKN